MELSNKEFWQNIPGTDDRYEISTLGNVRWKAKKLWESGKHPFLQPHVKIKTDFARRNKGKINVINNGSHQ